MMTLPLTLGRLTPKPQTTPDLKFGIAFHIFVLGQQYRDFQFNMRVDHSKSQPTDDKLFLKAA